MRIVTTVTYDTLKAAARRVGNCTVCGKKTTRTRTFEATVNPFNINKLSGKPKTYDQVQQELNAEAKAWQPEPSHFDHVVSCRS